MGNCRMASWNEFKASIIRSIEKGDIRFSKKLSEFDLEVQYATNLLYVQDKQQFSSVEVIEVLDKNVPSAEKLSREKIYG
ncbi:hypothetical protein NGC65_10580 [Staphylococcus xylosus]|uniref:hypothetical protein n=1 Tax=Staphylococcus xylosus TaxID=1288 RepID=UPI002DBE88D9|nr:hypothetical protein [Staphylococcus xylosus]MEB7865887.1 hypothetical protein [Staphylococcus xylosus]